MTASGNNEEAWRDLRLGDVVREIKGGGTPSRGTAEYWGGDIPWCTVKDLSSFDPNRTQEYITREGLENSATRIVPAGGLIICTRILVGATAIYNCEVAINQDMKYLELTDDVTPEFMKLLIASKANQLVRISAGSTVHGISIDDLRSLPIRIPQTLLEQQAITAAISDASVLIEALERRLAKTRDLKQGMAQELLSGRTRLV